MLNLMRWVSARIKAAAAPIETAGIDYQRMVSIHPFHDGNGRSRCFLMDFILQNAGLLLAALGDNVNFAPLARQQAVYHRCSQRGRGRYKSGLRSRKRRSAGI